MPALVNEPVSSASPSRLSERTTSGALASLATSAIACQFSASAAWMSGRVPLAACTPALASSGFAASRISGFLLTDWIASTAALNAAGSPDFASTAKPSSPRAIPT